LHDQLLGIQVFKNLRIQKHWCIRFQKDKYASVYEYHGKSSCSPAYSKKSKQLNHHLYAGSIEIVLYASLLVYKIANIHIFLNV
jgi:hypothetical protein